MRNNKYSPTELITQACALYIDFISEMQPQKQRKHLRDKLLVIGDLNQDTFPQILKNAEHMKPNFMNYLNEMERVACQARHPDSEEHLKAIPKYQRDLTQELAGKLNINADELEENIYLLNDLFFDFITPKIKVKS